MKKEPNKTLEIKKPVKVDTRAMFQKMVKSKKKGVDSAKGQKKRDN